MLNTVERANLQEYDLNGYKTTVFVGTYAECQKRGEEKGWAYQDESGSWIELIISVYCPKCGERMEPKSRIDGWMKNGWECPVCQEKLWDGNTWKDGEMNGYNYHVSYYEKPGLYHGLNGGRIRGIDVFKGKKGFRYYDGNWDREPVSTKEKEIYDALLVQFG